MKLDFSEFVETVLESSMHDAFLSLSEAFYKHFKETDEPFLLGKNQWDMQLKYPGKHVDPLLKKNDQNNIIVTGPSNNSLIPVHSVQWMTGKNRTDASKNTLSHFMRDQPVIAAFSQSSPENMASTIIFVLLTIRGSFQQVMQDFPLLMLILMGKFQKGVSEDGVELKSMITSLESLLARKSPKSELGPAEKNTRTIRLGYGTGTTVFGAGRPFDKFRGISDLWNRRKEIYSSAMNFVSKKDTVGLFGYFLKNIRGLGAPKVGFVVQLLFGEMGCIDMHNINLYSQYYTNREGLKKSPTEKYTPDHMNPTLGQMYKPETGEFGSFQGNLPTIKAPAAKRNLDMYNSIKKVMKSKAPGNAPNAEAVYSRTIKNYMNVIEELEKDGINTIKLWDYWVSYVAHIYGGSDFGQPYSRTGKMSGPTIDINNPADEKFLSIKDRIPDRNAIVSQSAKFLWVKDKDGVIRPYSKSKLLGKPDDDDSEDDLTKTKKELPTYKFKDIEKEKGAGGASLAHHATWWWRSKDYWYNLLKQAESGTTGGVEEPPEGMRYNERPKNVTASYLVAKPLAYLSLDVDLQNTIFPNEKERNEYMERLDAALGKLGFFSHENWLKKVKSHIKKASKEAEKNAAYKHTLF